MVFYHIISEADWASARARGEWRPESLAGEGFIHCSTSAELAKTADAYFKGRKDLLLLRILSERLASPLKLEFVPERGTEFPHIFGPLNLDAVAGVVPFPCRPDGTFGFPADAA